MVDHVRHHAQTGRVAQPEVAAPLLVQHSGVGVDGPRAVLDQVEADLAHQPPRQEVRAVRHRERVLRAEALEIGQPELAVAVERGAAHQVRRGAEHVRIGLLSCSKALRDSVEESAAAVAARPDDGASVGAAALLQGHVRTQPLQAFGVDRAFDQGQGDVPTGGDHPVLTLTLFQHLRERNQPPGVLTRGDPVDRHTATEVVHVERLTGHPPVVGDEVPDDAAGETVPGGAGSAHVGRVAHLVGRTQRGCLSG